MRYQFILNNIGVSTFVTTNVDTPSINGRMKTHPVSDRKMKSLLSMSAISAIQHDKQLKCYYQKRVEEGKPKMLVLNIIRNKLVARIFATVSRGTPYVELNQFAT